MEHVKRLERAEKISQARWVAITRGAGSMALDSNARVQSMIKAEKSLDQARATAVDVAKERTLAHLDANGFPDMQKISISGASEPSTRQSSLKPGWHLFTEHGKTEPDSNDGHLPYRDEYYLMADGTILQIGKLQTGTEPRVVSSIELSGDMVRYNRAMAAFYRLAPGDITKPE